MLVLTHTDKTSLPLTSLFSKTGKTPFSANRENNVCFTPFRSIHGYSTTVFSENSFSSADELVFTEGSGDSSYHLSWNGWHYDVLQMKKCTIKCQHWNNLVILQMLQLEEGDEVSLRSSYISPGARFTDISLCVTLNYVLDEQPWQLTEIYPTKRIVQTSPACFKFIHLTVSKN